MNENEIARIADMGHALPSNVYLEALAQVGEEWRPVQDYEATYAVSSWGRIYSHPRPTTSGGILKGSIDSHGYRRVALVQNGKQRTRRVHILVMQAFVGPAPEGLEIRHLDGDKLNAHLDNLAYGTHQENGMDTVAHGHNNQANKTHCPRNHPYDEANTYRWTDGRRRCRTCRKESRRVS